MKEPTILHATFTARAGEGDRVAALQQLIVAPSSVPAFLRRV
jgi:hypothetical protein